MLSRIRDKLLASARNRNVQIGVGVLLIAILSTILIPTGTPHVEVKAEPLFYIAPGFPFTNSMTVMLITDVLLIGLAFWATRNLQMVPRGLQNVMEMAIEALYNLFRTINRDYVARAFPLVATIFFYVLFANWLGLIPGVGSIGVCHEYHAEETTEARIELRLASTEPVANVLPAGARAEGDDPNPYDGCPAGTILVPLFRSPSADLNFTLALATLAWVYVEYQGFKALGVGYLKKFFNTDGIMSLVGIFEFIGELVKLPAFMFRLFGNIFAGEVVILVLTFLVPLFLPIPLYVFEIFVGFIQAFIFAVLTMAFITVAVTGHSEEHHEGAH